MPKYDNIITFYISDLGVQTRPNPDPKPWTGRGVFVYLAENVYTDESLLHSSHLKPTPILD